MNIRDGDLKESVCACDACDDVPSERLRLIKVIHFA